MFTRFCARVRSVGQSLYMYYAMYICVERARVCVFVLCANPVLPPNTDTTRHKRRIPFTGYRAKINTRTEYPAKDHPETGAQECFKSLITFIVCARARSVCRTTTGPAFYMHTYKHTIYLCCPVACVLYVLCNIAATANNRGICVMTSRA